MGRAVSRAVDQSSERAASAMIDAEGRTRLAGQGSVLRGYRMISVGEIAALMQVRGRADLGTFFCPLLAALRNMSSARRLFGHARAPILQDRCSLCRAPARSPHCVCSRVCRERYPLVGSSDPCLVTTTVLRCPLEVSLARRFLT
jgi:hypothetical protein